MTKPHGVISAAVWDYGGRMGMLRSLWDAATEIDPGATGLDERHMPLCRAGELARLWKQGGLRNIREQPLETSMAFASFNDYWEPFLLGQGPAGAYLRTLDEPRRQSLRAAAKQRLRIHSEDQTFTLPARVWAVRGTVPTY